MSDAVVRAGESAARLEAASDALLTEVASLPSELITWKVEKHLSQIRRNAKQFHERHSHS